MLRSLLLVASAALILSSPRALAFEETKAIAAPEPAQQLAPAKRGADKGALNLNGTGTSIETPAPAAAGTEIRIPGLGKLGVLPKLDFGLELLYGGRDEKAGEPDRNRAEGDDVQIRGSIRHRF